jgi:hypothetical protein
MPNACGGQKSNLPFSIFFCIFEFQLSFNHHSTGARLQTAIMGGIFLGFAEPDTEHRRMALYRVLLKAGMHPYPTDSVCTANHKLNITSAINIADCAILCLGQNGGPLVPELGMSVTEYQYLECRQLCIDNPKFKLYAWQPEYGDGLDDAYAAFTGKIRNEVLGNVYFSNHASAIALVEDVRMATSDEEVPKFDVNPTDIFLIYNQLDEAEAEAVTDLLADVVPLEKLNIIQDSGIDYAEYCRQQLEHSKLAVVYFKESADWALPFTKQIWQNSGGASSTTPILLIGDEEPETNVHKKLKAPKVVSLIMAGELIPLEIKVQYDRIVEPELQD